MKKKNRPMGCKDFMKYMPDWLDDNLYGKQADKFLEHMDNCEECREELHIQFLVKEGMSRLESGSGFNLDKELAGKVTTYRKRLANRHTMDVIIYWMEAIAFVAVVFILALVFYFR